MVVTTNPVMKIFHQSPPVNAWAISPPALVPAWARKTRSPNSESTAVAVKGMAVTNFPMRPMRPKMSPTRSVPAADPMEKVAPVGGEELPLTDEDAQCHPQA